MQKVYQSSAIDISLQEGAESDCANTEKVQQLLCPQDFSLQFYFFSESDSAKVLFCIKGHHNFFHKIAFFPKGISVLQTCPGTMKIGRNSQAIQLIDVGFIW